MTTQSARKQYSGAEKARVAADAGDGAGRDLPETPSEQTGGGPSNLSLSFEGDGGGKTEPGLGDGHHVYPTGARVRLSGCCHGLVQSLRH